MWVHLVISTRLPLASVPSLTFFSLVPLPIKFSQAVMHRAFPDLSQNYGQVGANPELYPVQLAHTSLPFGDLDGLKFT